MCGLIKKEEGTRSYDFSSLVLHLVNCDKNLANILPDSSLKKKKKKRESDRCSTFSRYEMDRKIFPSFLIPFRNE